MRAVHMPGVPGDRQNICMLASSADDNIDLILHTPFYSAAGGQLAAHNPVNLSDRHAGGQPASEASSLQHPHWL